MSNSLDPEQAQLNVGQDLGPNFLLKVISIQNWQVRGHCASYILVQ